MSEWLAENRLKTEAGAVACTAGTVLYLAPGWCWATATGHPLGFGVSLTLSGAAWVIRWEVQEQRIQRWLDLHLIRWFVPEDSESAEGSWEYASKGQKTPKQSATQMHDEWLEQVGRDPETAGRAAA